MFQVIRNCVCIISKRVIKIFNKLEEEKLVTMVIRVPKYKKDMIKNIAKIKEDMKQILLEVV